MAHASPKDRRIRKLKRERTLAFRLAKEAADQSSVWKAIAKQLSEELQKRDRKPEFTMNVVEGETLPERNPIEQDHQTDRPNESGAGLDVPQEPLPRV